jgi:hypothetical protein
MKGSEKFAAFVFVAGFAILIGGLFLEGCNRQVVDMTYSYNRCIIELPNGEIVEGNIDSWLDYEDGDQIQVKVNGTTYLVHSSDIALIKD